MITKEKYKKELVRIWDSIRDDEYKGTETCSGVTYCDECPLYNIGCGESSNAFKMIDVVEKWSKEHQPKKFKVSRMEYDILDMFIKNNGGINYVFNNFNDKYIPKLLEKGYFKGAKGNMSIRYYFDNCEVKKDV